MKIKIIGGKVKTSLLCTTLSRFNITAQSFPLLIAVYSFLKYPNSNNQTFLSFRYGVEQINHNSAILSNTRLSVNSEQVSSMDTLLATNKGIN